MQIDEERAAQAVDLAEGKRQGPLTFMQDGVMRGIERAKSFPGIPTPKKIAMAIASGVVPVKKELKALKKLGLVDVTPQGGWYSRAGTGKIAENDIGHINIGTKKLKKAEVTGDKVLRARGAGNRGGRGTASPGHTTRYKLGGV